jgi:REP element-mobilizing transposase RayT
MDIQPVIEEQYYHICNRGVNGEDIFKEKRNYYYFLEQYKFYCGDIMETLAYCLLKNHFHLLVYIKENIEVPRRDGKGGLFKLNASKQLGHFFNSYAQSVNKAYKRTGPLFESPFERKLVDDENYLLSVICYINSNAQHHGFVDNFRNWEFSSYDSVLKNNCTLVATDKAIESFGNVTALEKAHPAFAENKELHKYIIEY